MNTSVQHTVSKPQKLIGAATRLPPQVATYLLGIVAAMALYLPTFIDLWNGLWATAQNAHGPIVLLISAVLLYLRLFEAISDTANKPSRLADAAGWLMLVLSMALFVIGRSQAVYVFEVASFITFIMAINGIFLGWRSVRKAWLGYFFMLFVVPLPGSIIDVVTHPMKLAVSIGAEHLLYGLGYPIARAGVVLNIGQYQLLVADACAGLNSLFTLEALGLLYMNLVRHWSPWRNIVIAILIVPISFSANLIRVICLSLITYYWGDSVGQGFMHDFSGLVLFISALVMIILLDGGIRALLSARGKRPPEVCHE